MPEVYNGKEPYIFISYAHKDKNVVLPLVNGLMERGFRVWYDTGIEYGSEWPEYIAQRLMDAACVFAFITPNAVNSKNCRREINFAIEKNKELLSIYLGNVELPLGMQLQLNTLQAMYFTDFAKPSACLDNLCSAAIAKECKMTAVEQIVQEVSELEPYAEIASAPDPVTPVQVTHPQQEKPKGTNKGLIFTVFVLLIAIVLVIGYICAPLLFRDTDEEPQETGAASSSATSISCVSLELKHTSVVLKGLDGSFTLTATPIPADTTDKLVYTSSAPDIVSVDSNGNVRAVGYGQAVITVTCGSASAQCAVIVENSSSPTEIPCTSITLGAKNIVLGKANESFALAVTKVPTDTTDKVVFASADPTIAAVDQKGNVTPVGYGETEITVTCGKITEKCKVVSLVGEPPVTDPSTPPAPTTPVGFVLKLETYKNSGDVSFSAAGATHQLYKTTMGITAADITWTSSDPAVATVENGKVTAVNSGTCTITAAYGDQTATCLVRCSKSVVTIVSDYKLSHVDVMISDGETFTLTLSHKETGARVQDIEWQVSAEGVVTIDGNKITGGTVSKTTVVEVFVEYEGVTYTCIVRVKATGQ